MTIVGEEVSPRAAHELYLEALLAAVRDNTSALRDNTRATEANTALRRARETF